MNSAKKLTRTKGMDGGNALETITDEIPLQDYELQKGHPLSTGKLNGFGFDARRLGALEESDDLSVVQECLVGAFLLLLMFLVYLFTRRVTAPKAFNRIVRKK